jgi:ABC-type dipeptide/oligopeptide/nickel transport system permease subunit
MTAVSRLAVVRALRTPKGAIAGGLLILVILAALFAPWLAPFDYGAQNLPLAYAPPGGPYVLGTDELGRDLLSRIIYGARTSLTVAFISILVSVLAGLTLGAAAAYYGGLFDRIITSIVDLTWSFPEILIALILVAIIGGGLQTTMIAIAIAYLAQFTRLTRAQILTIKAETYVEASRSLGASDLFILSRHLIPNALAPVLVTAMMATGDAIILEATLGFFGLGAQPPTPSWGAMMSSGSALMFKAPGIIIFPGLALALTVIAINVYGDSLIRALDLRERLREV